MYEANKNERETLINEYGYNPEVIGCLDEESDNVRKGIPVDMSTAMIVCSHQSDLQAIRKLQKKWWQFWK